MLLKSPPGTTRDIFVDEASPQFEPDLFIRSPIRGPVHLMRTQRDIVARGDLAATLELECSRCLEPFATDVEIHFEEVYRPSLDVATGTPLKPPDDDALRISEQQVLDLKETVRQYLLTMVPIQPVCQPDCRGLCPNCGAVLNTEPCQCEAESRDGPFAVLRELLEDGTRGGDPKQR